MHLKTWQADTLLLLVAAIWGSTFILVKNATGDIPTFSFLFIRFGIAALGLASLRPTIAGWKDKNLWKAGITIGLLLFGGYAFQTWGLQFTSAAKAGFITGLSVVMVPIIVALVDKKTPSRFTIIGVTLAALGLGFLSLQGYSISVGDFLVLLCAFCFAGHIYTVAKYSGRFDPIKITAIQIATVAVISGLLALIFDRQADIAFTTQVWWGLAITAIPATSLAFWLQNHLQQYTTATHTALIFSSEPVFSYLFAFLLAGEILTLKAVLGAALIMGGILLSEMK